MLEGDRLVRFLFKLADGLTSPKSRRGFPRVQRARRAGCVLDELVVALRQAVGELLVMSLLILLVCVQFRLLPPLKGVACNFGCTVRSRGEQVRTVRVGDAVHDSDGGGGVGHGLVELRILLDEIDELELARGHCRDHIIREVLAVLALLLARVQQAQVHLHAQHERLALGGDALGGAFVIVEIWNVLHHELRHRDGRDRHLCSVHCATVVPQPTRL